MSSPVALERECLMNDWNPIVDWNDEYQLENCELLRLAEYVPSSYTLYPFAIRISSAFMYYYPFHFLRHPTPPLH